MKESKQENNPFIKENRAMILSLTVTHHHSLSVFT